MFVKGTQASGMEVLAMLKHGRTFFHGIMNSLGAETHLVTKPRMVRVPVSAVIATDDEGTAQL